MRHTVILAILIFRWYLLASSSNPLKLVVDEIQHTEKKLQAVKTKVPSLKHIKGEENSKAIQIPKAIVPSSSINNTRQLSVEEMKTLSPIASRPKPRPKRANNEIITKSPDSKTFSKKTRAPAMKDMKKSKAEKGPHIDSTPIFTPSMAPTKTVYFNAGNSLNNGCNHYCSTIGKICYDDDIAILGSVTGCLQAMNNLGLVIPSDQCYEGNGPNGPPYHNQQAPCTYRQNTINPHGACYVRTDGIPSACSYYGGDDDGISQPTADNHNPIGGDEYICICRDS